MTKYNTFLTVFIITVIATVAFFIFYVQAIMGFGSHMRQMQADGFNLNPFEILGGIFTPGVIATLIIMVIGSLVYRIIGIVNVARTKTVSDGEKALWIVGFVLMGFVTGIVFLVMSKGRKFVE